MERDLYHGNGKSYYENGNIEYDGEWVDEGEWVGEWVDGKFYYDNGKIRYDGDRKKDYPME